MPLVSLYPLKTSENHFRGYRKRSVAWNGLRTLSNIYDETFLKQQLTAHTHFNQAYVTKSVWSIFEHVVPLVSFCTLWKHPETKDFLKFSGRMGGIERDHWHEIGLGATFISSLAMDSNSLMWSFKNSFYSIFRNLQGLIMCVCVCVCVCVCTCVRVCVCVLFWWSLNDINPI